MKNYKVLRFKAVFIFLTILILLTPSSSGAETFTLASAEHESEPRNDDYLSGNQRGDVTGSGDVNVQDVTAIVQHVLGIKLLNEKQQELADVNNDGIINVLDVTNTMQYVLGVIDSLDDAPANLPKTEPEPEPEPAPGPEPQPEPGLISVQIRIENWEHTTVPLRQIEVAAHDIVHVVGDNAVGNWHKNNDAPLAIHAISKALELGGFNVQDKDVITVSSQGNYISKIDGLFEMEKGGLSGWGYRVDGISVDLGVGQQTLKTGDLVEVYYRAGDSYHFGKIEASLIEISTGGTVAFTVTGQPGSFGDPLPYEPISEAVITINGSKTDHVTDNSGKVEIPFSNPGTYDISAEKIEGNKYNLIRPVPARVVVK